MNVNDKITLIPISKHGKDRVNSFGTEWLIKRIVNKVAFSSKKGLWIGIEDVFKKDFRWVLSKNDINFKIV